VAVIKVPKAPRKAFDSSRPPGDLLKRQIEHLEWAIRPASQRSPQQLKPYVPKTEGDAAAHIAKLTGQLHKVSAAAPATLPPQEPAAVQARAAVKAKLQKRGPAASGRAARKRRRPQRASQRGGRTRRTKRRAKRSSKK
jgi:hypothetical protein